MSVTQFYRFALLLLGALLCLPAAPAEPSRIYGPNGESWNRTGGPLPDFSFAGYHRGEKPLPERTPDFSVADFGAVGDGTTDDTAAIQKAIDENPGKTILLPAGRYLLSDILHIRKSGTVLQGEGPGKTVLTVSAPLQEIHPKPITYPDTGGTAYAYSGGFIETKGSSGYYDSSGHAVEEPATRGATTLTLSPGHPFRPGDEIVIIIRDEPGQSLLTYLYRDDPSDISAAGASKQIRHVTRLTTVDGPTLTLERPLRTDLRLEWKPAAHAFKPRLEEVGIEHLAFEFPKTPYRGHFTEAGYNAIHLNGTLNSWIRNVRIRNADSGIALGHCVFSTLTGIVVESERKPDDRGNTGHHALMLNSVDCLCTGFDIRTRFIHDLTVTSGSLGNVFSNGKGLDIALDHHRLAPYENLFSNIDLGGGARIFNSGGRERIGRHAAAGNTYWNLQSKEYVEVPDDFAPARLNLIGLKMRSRGARQDPEARWIETIRPGTLEPADLHAAQLARRLGKTPDTNEPAVPGKIHAWTNLDGKTIPAAFGGLVGDRVVLIINGKPTPYPLSKLTPASRALAKSLTSSPAP